MHFQCRALPFGLSSAPKIFTKVLGEALAPLREWEICIHPYLDDHLLQAPSVPMLSAYLHQTQVWLQELGWLINTQKSVLHPSQVLTYLGYEINTKEKEDISSPTEIRKATSGACSLSLTVQKCQKLEVNYWSDDIFNTGSAMGSLPSASHSTNLCFRPGMV